MEDSYDGIAAGTGARRGAMPAREPSGRRSRVARYAATLAMLSLPALAPCIAPVFAVAEAATKSTPDAELKAALAAMPDATRGAELYRTCAACHGPDGGGVADGSIPAIAGQPQRVLVKQLADFRRSARLDVRMEHFADRRHLQGAQDIADVAAHAASLSRSVPAGHGTGVALEAGSRAWLEDCSACHGASGKADAQRMVPRLAGQHAGYLERQLLDAAAGRRPNMTAVHRRLLRELSEEQMAGIADYLSRMK
jgi:cytochrome c553